MAATIVRSATSAAPRFLAAKNGTSIGRILVVGGCHQIQVATLKATYGEKYPYAKPYPYESKRFGPLMELIDSTRGRLCENSKVITVEGNVAVGKKEFAKRLAKDFDLKYFDPTPDDKQFIVPETGFDMRSLNDMLPPSVRPYDLRTFYQDPHVGNGVVGRLQIEWYAQKFRDYCRAMTHLLSTGQGVVLVRSAYSDNVFVEAMRRMGYVTPNFVKYYNKVRNNSICELLTPHVTVYLDAPIDTIKKRIAARNDDREVNSKVLNDKYLQQIESVYKEKYLPRMRASGEVVEIDWAEVADEMDMDVIAEEMQVLHLESEDADDVKFEDWFNVSKDDLTRHRKNFQTEHFFNNLFSMPDPYECPEIMPTHDESDIAKKVIYSHPAIKFKPGWASDLGDNVLFKF